MLALCAGPVFAADRIEGTAENGYRRLAFTLESPAKISASTTGGVLAITFDRKPTLDAATIAAAAPGVIANGHADADGKTLRFALSLPVKLHLNQQGLKAVLDLAPLDFKGAMPDLPPPAKPPPPRPVDPATLPEVKLRSGSYSNFTRLVFDWSREVPYSVFAGAGKITVKFGAGARMDVSALSRFPAPWVKDAAWRLDGGATLVELGTDSDSGYHDFRDGTHVVLDILAPKTDAAAYAPPGIAKPSVTKMGVTRIPAGASAAQAAAIVNAAATLAGRKPEEKPAETKAPEAKPAEKKPETKEAASEPSAPPPPAANGQVIGNSASLSFRNPGPAAVFIRGLTAWVVLENAPALDLAALRKGLEGFAAGVETSSTPGLSILRVTLKAPAKAASRMDGSVLKVQLGPDVTSNAAIIGFARNQADAQRSSLTTTLPNADRAISLTDPQSGDTMTVVPAAPGYAMPAQKVFADFAALPSAQGLVLTPYTDDLSVTVHEARITIARPGGMALTPPQMPVASSPAALANSTGSPSYLDFAKWGVQSAGSFLATQRALEHDIATAQKAQMNVARLRLARFYLAQGFAPEALGVMDLIQNSDPGLKGDIHLTTMRAAAEVQMGRYRDARSELAGPLFEADRHAALWRGLADAGMENWKPAQSELEMAGTILSRYPVAWRGRAILAEAEAAMGLGRLDLADAALVRLPKDLPPSLALQGRLDRARVVATEGRFAAALPEFLALEKSGDARIEAQAIYYRTETGLTAGVITSARAIETLERLRFRWRGDGLELRTLRKLASLYFKAGNWDGGLKTLRVATENFSGNAARAAQDDMRAAFISLYLKGAADKLPPLQSLAMFYDNSDLTPIGPDGDEMIRRMADRLVAVDLLGEATRLLAYQVDKRLDGVAKAQVATRLAALQVMDGKPADAVTTLRGSEITGLPPDMIHARLLLEARAYAALKQYDNAIDLLAVDKEADTASLRADIYWESGNWAVAGQKLEEMLGTRFSDEAPLSAAERGNVLRAAVAYSLANDEKSLERLRANFSPKMKVAPDGNLFAVLSAPIDMHGLAFRDAAAQIASVNTLKGFMQDFQKKFSAPAKAS
jgi:tetratricopeptide (TPR) repeat protein